MQSTDTIKRGSTAKLPSQSGHVPLKTPLDEVKEKNNRKNTTKKAHGQKSPGPAVNKRPTDQPSPTHTGPVPRTNPGARKSYLRFLK